MSTKKDEKVTVKIVRGTRIEGVAYQPIRDEKSGKTTYPEVEVSKQLAAELVRAKKAEFVNPPVEK